MIRLIALDLDGTLLNPDESIDTLTVNLLNELYNRSIIIAIVTGRPYCQTVKILRNNNLPLEQGFPQILICNGRDYYRLFNNKYILKNGKLKKQEADYIDQARYIVAKLVCESQLPFLINNIPLQKIRGYVEFMMLEKEQALKTFELLKRKTQNLPLMPVRNRRHIALRIENTGKDKILLSIVKEMGLDLSSILVMGDSHNDLGMLTAGFFPATTQNAEQEIKESVKKQEGVISSLGYSLGVAEVLNMIISSKGDLSILSRSRPSE